MSPAELFSSIPQGIRVTAEVDKVAAMPEHFQMADFVNMPAAGETASPVLLLELAQWRCGPLGA